MKFHRRSFTNGQKLDTLSKVQERRDEGSESLQQIAHSLELDPCQVGRWSRLSVLLSTSSKSLKKNGRSTTISLALQQWILKQHECGQCLSLKNIILKAADLDPQLCQRSEDARRKCIQRFAARHDIILHRRNLALCRQTAGTTQQPATQQQPIQQQPIQQQPMVFQGKQWDFPVIPPDYIDSRQFTSADEARQSYEEIRVKHGRKRDKYVQGALYNNLIAGTYLVLDHEVIGDFNISITYSPGATSGREQDAATTMVRVRSASGYAAYLQSLLLVDCQLKAKKDVVRQGRGDFGDMWQLGVKNRGRLDRKCYKATESCTCNTVPLLPLMNSLMTDCFRELFPSEFYDIQIRNKGIEIEDNVGGDGSLHTFSVSRNLGNASHIDSGDESVGISTWIEEKPGKAQNWFFILPFTTLVNDPNKAVVIKLSHGISIAWNGKVLHHCTSMTTTGDLNHVYGNFTSSSKARSLG